MLGKRFFEPLRCGIVGSVARLEAAGRGGNESDRDVSDGERLCCISATPDWPYLSLYSTQTSCRIVSLSSM